MTIDILIDKKDSFELIRDNIAEILAEETISQQALAIAAGKNPELWKFKVFVERRDAWEMFYNNEIECPIVVIFFEKCKFSGKASASALYMSAVGQFPIYVISAATGEKTSEGQKKADKSAIFNTQRIVRLVRNILYAQPAVNNDPEADYQYLNLRGKVGSRRLSEVEMIDIDQKKQAIQISMAKMTLEVGYVESAIEKSSEIIEMIELETKINDENEMIFQFELEEN